MLLKIFLVALIAVGAEAQVDHLDVPCSVTCSWDNNSQDPIQVLHNTDSGHDEHRCWGVGEDGLDGCSCKCCTGANCHTTLTKPLPTCFFMQTGAYEYDEARSQCQEHDGADIASIHSEAENDLVRTLHATSGGWSHARSTSGFANEQYEAAYLGAVQTGTGWTWSDGSAWDYSPSNSASHSHGNFCEEGQNNCKRLNDYGGQDETRIAMSYDFGHQKWEDWGTGYSNLHAICRGNYKASDCAALGGVSESDEIRQCFFMQKGAFQYDEARSQCQEHDGADIASIHSEAENDLVRLLHSVSTSGGGQSAYLGAVQTPETNDGVDPETGHGYNRDHDLAMSGWSWSDGSAWDYMPPKSAASQGWHNSTERGYGSECNDDNHNCQRVVNYYGHDETRIAMSYDGGHQKWEDWGTGNHDLHAICRGNYKFTDCAALGGVSGAVSENL